jgi:hypothetical protein
LAPLSAKPGLSKELPSRAAATKDKIRTVLDPRIEVSPFFSLKLLLEEHWG